MQRLDYGKIRLRLTNLCFLPLAKEMAESLTPQICREDVALALQETDEGKELLRLNPLFAVRGAREIRPYVERCQRGGFLNPEELIHLRDTLRAARQARQQLLDSKNEYPRLKGIVSPMEPQKALEDEITRCVSEDGAVSDKATPLLAELRREQNRLQQRIRETLDGILRNPAYQKMIQDPLVTLRSDRYVIPIKQEYRAAFTGIIHDQSASGATLFIEPMQVVRLGNDLREVVLKEQREVLRILQQLALNIDSMAEKIIFLYEVLAHVDFILGKARLSLEMNAGSAELTEKQEVRLIQARHPLLTEPVVPITVELGLNFDMLVITGPNTGGKTVALKTAGLLAAMTQSGLHIPAEHGSRMGIFTQIFADIGDEQSVEQSLSTFSGHMKNIIQIINQADKHSLVLLDEVGAGTDPTEGAALGRAILAELHERGCRTIATTHYGALKSFAYQTPRVQNASVEFDIETLRPTYRLLIGIPGKSNAFSIAGRLGLSNGVLEKAKTFVAEREMQVANLLENLEDTQREIETEKQKAQEERKSVEQQTRALKQKSLQQDEDYQALIAKAKDEAVEILRQAKREAEALIDGLKESLKNQRNEQQSIEKARQGLRQLGAKLEAKAAPPGGGIRPEQVKLGQMVYMTKLRQKGQVIKLPNDSGEILVQAGVMKVTVSLAEIRLVTEEQPVGRVSGQGKLGLSKAETVRNEINVRGMLVDEACHVLDKYLDDAVISGINQIYIIHGKGTGALRTGVQDFLRGHHHVKNFRLGQHGEGDLGVTVVELK